MKLNPTSEMILAALHRNSGDLSGEQLCRVLGISRAAVWKHIQILRQIGYTIDSATHRGYRLASIPNFPFPWEIRRRLQTRWLGARIEYRPQVESTNTAAIEAAKQQAEEGFCLIADQQTRGRGRLQRPWFSPAGRNLYVSIVLRPEILPSAVPQISLIAALGLLRTVRKWLAASRVRIKWPNDLYVDNKKLAGILCESSSELDRVHYVVVGIGINVNLAAHELPSELTDSAISLSMAAELEIMRFELAAELLNEFAPLYRDWARNGLAGFMEELESVSWLNQRQVVIRTPHGERRGTVTGLSDQGALRLYDPVKRCEELVYSGDIQLLPLAPSED